MKEHVELDYDETVQLAQQKNLVWSLVRQTDVKNQSVSSWTGFNIQTRNNVNITEDKVGYLPSINAPATNMSTVNEILHQALKISETLDLKEIACYFDQALYAKAAEIIWKNEEKFRPIVIRMGAFHTICNMMGTIGKRFQDAGLRDLAVESGVTAEGSITAVLEERHYNRSLRLHKLVYEALLRLASKGFFLWMEENHQNDMPELNNAITQI